MRRWYNVVVMSFLKRSEMLTTNWNIYHCHWSISVTVHSKLEQRRWLMTSNCKAHGSKGSKSGTPCVGPMVQTQRKGTECRRILPEILAEASCWVDRKGLCFEILVEHAKLANHWFAIPMRKERERVIRRYVPLLVRSQNMRVIPRSRTCNLSKLTVFIHCMVLIRDLQMRTEQEVMGTVTN